MEITGTWLMGIMFGVGYNIDMNQIDIFLGIIAITIRWGS
jgi:hypothetical protein